MVFNTLQGEHMSKQYNKKLTRTKVQAAIETNGGCGSFTEIANRCEVSRTAIVKFLEKPVNSDLLELFRDGMEKLIDLAETRIAHRVDRDDFAAICFLLKTKGKHRGWGEAPLLQIPDGAIRIELVPIGFDIPKHDAVEAEVVIKEIEDKTTTNY